jgi:hypothetical protein
MAWVDPVSLKLGPLTYCWAKPTPSNIPEEVAGTAFGSHELALPPRMNSDLLALGLGLGFNEAALRVLGLGEADLLRGLGFGEAALTRGLGFGEAALTRGLGLGVAALTRVLGLGEADLLRGLGEADLLRGLGEADLLLQLLRGLGLLAGELVLFFAHDDDDGISLVSVLITHFSLAEGGYKTYYLHTT